MSDNQQPVSKLPEEKEESAPKENPSEDQELTFEQDRILNLILHNFALTNQLHKARGEPEIPFEEFLNTL
jgi:hypothetical protein